MNESLDIAKCHQSHEVTEQTPAQRWQCYF